jgi:hypothetical protein
MSEKYFSNFPLALYANTFCVDIVRRVAISDKVKNNIFAYYPYEMKSHQRPDTIADKYYNNPYFSWLVYFANQTIDPYYDYPLDDQTFLQFIDEKYGGEANAKQLILYWQLNWAENNDEEITSEYFNTNLPEPLKKYYDPVYGEGTRILFYRRRQEDWKASTNRVVTFLIENANGTFQNDEPIRLHTDANTSVANAYVMFANSSQVMVKHVLGNTILSNTNTEFVVGMNSNATANAIQTIYVQNTLSQDEQVYWSPMYAWDYETNENEKRKFIYIIDSKYAYDLSNDLNNKVNE